MWGTPEGKHRNVSHLYIMDYLYVFAWSHTFVYVFLMHLHFLFICLHLFVWHCHNLQCDSRLSHHLPPLECTGKWGPNDKSLFGPPGKFTIFSYLMFLTNFSICF